MGCRGCVKSGYKEWKERKKVGNLKAKMRRRREYLRIGSQLFLFSYRVFCWEEETLLLFVHFSSTWFVFYAFLSLWLSLSLSLSLWPHSLPNIFLFTFVGSIHWLQDHVLTLTMFAGEQVERQPSRQEWLKQEWTEKQRMDRETENGQRNREWTEKQRMDRETENGQRNREWTEKQRMLVRGQILSLNVETVIMHELNDQQSTSVFFFPSHNDIDLLGKKLHSSQLAHFHKKIHLSSSPSHSLASLCLRILGHICRNFVTRVSGLVWHTT